MLPLGMTFKKGASPPCVQIKNAGTLRDLWGFFLTLALNYFNHLYVWGTPNKIFPNLSGQDGFQYVFFPPQRKKPINLQTCAHILINDFT